MKKSKKQSLKDWTAKIHRVLPVRIGKQKCFKIVCPDGDYYIHGYTPKPEEVWTTPLFDAERIARRFDAAFWLGLVIGRLGVEEIELKAPRRGAEYQKPPLRRAFNVSSIPAAELTKHGKRKTKAGKK